MQLAVFLGNLTAFIRLPIESGAQGLLRIPDSRESPGPIHKAKTNGATLPLSCASMMAEVSVGLPNLNSSAHEAGTQEPLGRDHPHLKATSGHSQALS